ncbi:ester cyclase [Peribacillus muralis]|uniref:ester cyclase n=1 Tax=Peribacillus muralis TaxID=264697 RepID=UPI00366F4126
MWSDQDKEGFYSSHQLHSTATGEKVNFSTPVDCSVHTNPVYEVRQLGGGQNADALKKDSVLQLSSDTMSGSLPDMFEPCSSLFIIGEFVMEMYNKVWEWRLFNHIKDFYADHAVVHYTCDKDLVGCNQIQGMLRRFFESFPNAKVAIDCITCNQSGEKGDWDVSVRWRLGNPSQFPVEILGINQLRVQNEKIVEEWFTFDINTY